jgi:4-diphosphocytidyl-2-C-methyl-D-erythritol kinase
MPRIQIAAPCKINLHLSVGERRPDGFHNLESIFQILDFGDILDFETVEERGFCGIEAVSRLPQGDFCLPAGENIVYRALSLFRSRTGFDRGIRISLEKRVPLGGGLGGGSSDAASTLAALDMLAGTGLSLAELRDMALCLGSDVPFFLADPPTAAGFPPALSAAAGRGGAAWVSGRGERIFPVGTPLVPGYSGALAVVLVNPGFPSPTGEAFRRLDAWRSIAGGDAFERDALIQALAGDPRNWPYRNDFFPVLSAGDGREAAAYRRIISALREGGADFAGLSGAGSTFFGVFKDKGVAIEVTKLLLNEWFFVQLTFFLARSAIQVLEY